MSFQRILIANRGEIAIRVMRAAADLGISTVAVYSEDDSASLHATVTDQAYLLQGKGVLAYLDIEGIINVAKQSSCDAIHPGYGFLAENPEFARKCAENEIVFIGPDIDHLALFGDKGRAKSAAVAAHVPVLRGVDRAVTLEEAQEFFESLQDGSGMMLKAVNGGGGRGSRAITDKTQIENSYKRCKSEATNAFGNGDLYVEEFIENARHIEVQIMGDGTGKVIHLGERDCSLQRRNQKVLEEAPSPALNAATRANIGQVVVDALSKIKYTSLGTVEFLYEEGEFYFIEMNTRLQVEHPVTEAITGIDLVREQIRIAAGAPLSFDQKDIRFSGHAIECRINAEHPKTFVPSPGQVGDFHAPGGLGVRVDSGLYAGYRIPPYYDSLIAKLVVHGATRNDCLMRLNRALGEFVIDGIEVNIPLHRDLIQQQNFIDGDYHIHWLEQFLDQRE